MRKFRGIALVRARVIQQRVSLKIILFRVETPHPLQQPSILSVTKLIVQLPMLSFSSTGNLEFHSVGTSLLMILGLTSQRYLSIRDDGLLHGSVSIFALFFVVDENFS